jgi:PKD repeat protein
MNLKSTSKKLLLLLAFLVSNLTLVNAQIVTQESFNGTTFQPAGWSLDPTLGQPNWARRTVGVSNIPTHTGAGMARFLTTTVPVGTQQSLVTPAIDLSNLNGTTATFSFWMYRDSLSTLLDSLTILVNTTPTSIGAQRLGVIARSRYSVLPNNEPINGWYQYTYNWPVTFTGTTNYILFQGTAQGGSQIYVDDVEYTSYPTPCSGQPTAGTVNASTTLICGGSGSANLSLVGATEQLGISYHWENAASSSGPWTSFGANATSETTGTITSSTFYRCVITCDSSLLSDTTAAVEVVVSQNALPVIITSPNSPVLFCNGSAPVTLFATGADTYTWSPATGLSATSGDSVTSSPTADITYTVTGTDLIGCTSTSTISVNFSNPPNINAFSNRSSVCPGDTTALRIQNIGGGFGNTYLWNPGGLTGNNVTVNIDSTITYSVIATNTSGCTTADSVTINMIANIAPAFGYTATGQTVVFSDSSNGAISWLWLFGDGNASFAQNPTYTYSGTGTFNVSLIVSNGLCDPETLTTAITITATGLSGVEGDTEMNLYPNPAKENTTLLFNSTSQTADLFILNAMGAVVLQKQISVGKSGRFEEVLDLKQFSRGVYLIRINTESESGIRRLTIE